MSRLSAPQAICFDLDGTLIDSVADLASSANWTRRHYGLHELPAAQVSRYIGDGARKLIERTLQDLGDALDVEEALSVFRTHYLEHCLERTRCYPGVPETLERLRGIPLAIVTNKPQPMADKIADGLGLRSFLGAVVGARPGIPVKPEPALVQLALAQLHRSARGAWMVGDSRNDVGVGRRLGMGVVAVGYCLTSVEDLRPLEPDALIDRFEQLLEFL
jgi:phosphoglycolate phosphatase